MYSQTTIPGLHETRERERKRKVSSNTIQLIISGNKDQKHKRKLKEQRAVKYKSIIHK